MENQSITTYELSTLDITVGTIYIAVSVPFIFLHTICGYVMFTDKDMKNPTFYFMVNLSICDIITLSMIGIYPGIISLTHWQNDTVLRWASFLAVAGWYANVVLMPLAAFSRWVAITRPHQMKIIFKCSILWSLQALAWLMVGVVIFYGNVLNAGEPMAPYYPAIYTFGFNPNTPMGRTFNWLNVVIDSICTAIGVSFNGLSLYHVNKTRKQVQHVGSKENGRREIKLLLQCVIMECVFIFSYIFFTCVFAQKELTMIWFLSFHATWITNHSVNPVVYLTVNTRLRKRTLNILTRGKLGIGP